jgi:holo-[acyl-carrier protein] synthase
VIFGVGTDIVDVARIQRAMERHGNAFAERILSTFEWQEYAVQNHRARFLAKRFAAKEAFAKATGQGLRHPVTLHNLSVTHDELGKPTFAFAAELSDHLRRMGAGRHHLSISDEREMVVALVVLETADNG